MTDLCKAALDAALDALERSDKDDFWREKASAIEALRAALAEPQPEPVAWRVRVDGLWLHAASRDGLAQAIEVKLGRAVDKASIEPLYAAPKAQAQQPLTDEQIDAIPCTDGDGSDWDALLRFARAIERAHGIGKP